MSLPGKLCFGILEEDNPQKSYFRFRPLLIESEGKFVPFADYDAYPEDGCIRIVPDKNESSHFKNRMRRIGKYAVVDLVAHGGENDKIRPNKNYRGDGAEQNANIIYSDVVLAAPIGFVLDILQLEVPEESTRMALGMPLPNTRHVLVKGAGGAINGYVWIAEPIEGIEDCFSVLRTQSAPILENSQEFDIEGFRGEQLHFMLAMPGNRLIPAADIAEFEPPAQPAPAAMPTEDAAPQAFAAIPPPLPGPEPDIPDAQPARTPPPRLTPQEHSLLMQSGLNPRRGRSLQEVIEDKWRRSRIDQLGHPVPAEATGHPVLSPIERALCCIREALALPDARDTMLRELGGLQAPTNAALEQEYARQLNELEAQRLSLLDDVNALKMGRHDLRETLIGEIKRDNANLFDADERKRAELEAQLDQLQRDIDQARDAKRAADEAICGITNENIEKRLAEFALTSHAVDLVWKLKSSRAKPGIPVAAAGAIAAEDLFGGAIAHFASAGHALSRIEIVNLLACFALSPVTILTGPTGSGKTSTADLLAGALGIKRAGRFARFAPASERAADRDTLNDLLSCDDRGAPIAALVDDMNALPMEAHSSALLAHIDSGSANPALRLLLTAQDSPSGHPLPAHLVDRAFTIRLSCEGAASDWAPRAAGIATAEHIVSQEALRAIFQPGAEPLPEEVSGKMKILRAKLAEYGALLSRRTLDALWLYCAAVTRYMQATPMQVFDMAFAQRALPSILAGAPIEALHALPTLLSGMPASLALLRQPMPLDI